MSTIEEEIAAKIREVDGAHKMSASALSTALMPLVKRAQAEAWFAGYDKGNLDGYFGTRAERAKSPYADLDPYNESEASDV